MENGSKNRRGVNTKETNKVVPVYASRSTRPRCLVYLLDLYLSKLPAGSKEWDVFYLRPAAKVPADPTAPWYERAPVGKEKLRTFVVTMCQEAGIAPKTNHGLRATGATALFNANVPETLIRYDIAAICYSCVNTQLCSRSRLYQVSWCKVNQQWRQGKRITIQYQYAMLHTTAAG